MSKEKEVVVLDEQATPAMIISQAIAQGSNLEQIEKLMILQEKYEANEARKVFFKAKAAFKADVPAVVKDRQNKQYDSMYASEDALLNTINPILSKHGLEVYFDFPQHENLISVRCILSHEKGHNESVTLSGPADDSGKKNRLQQIKSTTTYLRKATFEAITGIATTEKGSDDDGNALNKISDEQLRTINNLIKEKEVDIKLFLTYMRVESLDEILAADFQKAIAALKAKK